MATAALNQEATVFVVDDDDAVRESLAFLMKSIGLKAESFPSAQDFLNSYNPARAGCLVLDIRMPGMSGLELQDKLIQMGSILPIIFITGHGDVPMAVKAIKAGAADFVQKPFRDQELIDRIREVLEEDSHARAEKLQRTEILRRMETLTEREREVMGQVVDGKANKVVAIDLNVSQRTVEIHRANVMEKMKARSLAQLVRLVMKARGEL
ncbi:MAG: response regulator transcription factor [Pseudomonadales bacterium]|jgi:two-component system response regulator FixJ|nr:response regulator transcription factor [Cellvibrionales bacterium]MBP8030055.1 response regulator transcription factor [Pseudomonadales bacterium]